MLPRGDFVIVTVPETPETQGLFTTEKFKLMKPTAFFINIGRGATVALDDLNAALRSGEIAGAGLDVFEVEPLPEGHPLWTGAQLPDDASRGRGRAVPGRAADRASGGELPALR